MTLRCDSAAIEIDWYTKKSRRKHQQTSNELKDSGAHENVDVIKIILDEGVDDFDDLRYVSDGPPSGSEVDHPSEIDSEE